MTPSYEPVRLAQGHAFMGTEQGGDAQFKKSKVKNFVKIFDNGLPPSMHQLPYSKQQYTTTVVGIFLQYTTTVTHLQT